jgi:hypothetical protein
VRPWVRPWNAAAGRITRTVASQRPALHRHQHSVALGVGDHAGLRRIDLDDPTVRPSNWARTSARARKVRPSFMRTASRATSGRGRRKALQTCSRSR